MADSTTILTVVGARPQFIKAATVSRVIAERPGTREVLVHPATLRRKHSTRSSRLAILAGIIWESVRGGAQTGAMLEGIERILLDERPDWLLVYGDTNSTIAGALAAAKLHIPVAHVEAGMRSFNRRMPEELNRVLTDHLATLNLTSTSTATAHLSTEGIDGERVLEVGDVMYDAALFYGDRAGAGRNCLTVSASTRRIPVGDDPRAKNTDDPERMNAIVDAFVGWAAITSSFCRTRAVLDPAISIDSATPSLANRWATSTWWRWTATGPRRHGLGNEGSLLPRHAVHPAGRDGMGRARQSGGSIVPPCSRGHRDRRPERHWNPRFGHRAVRMWQCRRARRRCAGRCARVIRCAAGGSTTTPVPPTNRVEPDTMRWRRS